MTIRYAAVAACLFCPGLAAQDREPLTLTITGTRTARPVAQSLAPVTVIGREDIHRQQSRSVAELLRGLPGVNVDAQGGYGKQTSLFVRGANSDHVLLLIDGVRHESATLGLPALQHLPPEQIERIEYVRGPRSSLYGSDAIGGVIQVFTRRGAPGLQAGGSAGFGTYDSGQLSAWLGGGHDNTTFNLGVSHFRTDGFNATTPASFVFEPDADGYENNAVNLRLEHSFGGGWRIAAHGLRAEGDNEFDSGGTRPSDETVQQILGLDLEAPLTGVWTSRLHIGESRDEFEARDPVFPGRFDTRRHVVNWQNDLDLAPGQLLTLGVDYYRDAVDSSTAFTEDDTDNLGVFVQHQARFGRHEVIAGLRHEDTDAFGGETTGNLGWGFDLTPALRLTAAYGGGFATPTFNDLFFPD
ncbi:MAG: TonB-dependent receptor, partial [Pseudomonadota bacterium]|nr:TonB-dependent receptor [Pseudomonadota bacterium]